MKAYFKESSSSDAMILTKLFRTFNNFTIFQERSGGTVSVDQMRKSLPSFSSSIRRAKALFALPRRSAINQAPSRFVSTICPT
jgi:hypothetical protein